MKVIASLHTYQTLVAILMFAQSTEVINPATNNGLPAGPAVTNPSMKFACKGTSMRIFVSDSHFRIRAAVDNAFGVELMACIQLIRRGGPSDLCSRVRGGR
jgi:hypothetical protein